MRLVKSCGFLLLRQEPERSFLLMRHPTRWDLPKGHVEEGESELECAYRELYEETGIEAHDIDWDEKFRFTLEYPVDMNQLCAASVVSVSRAIVRGVRKAKGLGGPP